MRESYFYERQENKMKRMNKALASMIMAGTVCAAVMAGPGSAGVMQDSAPDASKLPAGTLIYRRARRILIRRLSCSDGRRLRG